MFVERCRGALQREISNKLCIISGERGTVALRHEARCTCQCCPGLPLCPPSGWQVPSAAVACRTAATGRVTLCVSVIVRAVHQSSSKLGDTPLARLDLFESLPSRGFAVEPLQQTLQQNRALQCSTSASLCPAPDVELYSSTALQRALYISTALSTALYTYILYTLSLSVRAAAAYTARGFLTDYYVLERV